MKIVQVLFIVGLLGFISCSEAPASEQSGEAESTSIYKRVSVSDFQTKISTATNPQLIDVRTPAEYERGNISGSVNINFHAEDFLQKVSKFDKIKPVYVYCQVGGRSKTAALKMKSMGFAEIYELKRGYSAWEQ